LTYKQSLQSRLQISEKVKDLEESKSLRPKSSKKLPPQPVDCQIEKYEEYLENHLEK